MNSLLIGMAMGVAILWSVLGALKLRDALAAKKTSTPRASDIVHCPVCHGIDFTRAFSIVGARLEGGRIVAVERGAMLSCQRCGHQFALTPDGLLERHAEALPPMRRTTSAPAAAPEHDEPPRKPGKVKVDGLIPKERPRV